jgi:hypothetical protein
MTKVTLGGGLEVMVDFSKPSSKCRGCGAEIYWCKTPSGQTMPIILHSHFADCPKADEFRESKKKKD